MEFKSKLEELIATNEVFGLDLYDGVGVVDSTQESKVSRGWGKLDPSADFFQEDRKANKFDPPSKEVKNNNISNINISYERFGGQSKTSSGNIAEDDFDSKSTTNCDNKLIIVLKTYSTSSEATSPKATPSKETPPKATPCSNKVIPNIVVTPPPGEDTSSSNNFSLHFFGSENGEQGYRTPSSPSESFLKKITCEASLQESGELGEPPCKTI